jgi:hypothetical protein
MVDVCIFYGRLVYLMGIWYFCGLLGSFMVIRYIIYRLGILYQEKSGNPAWVQLHLQRKHSRLWPQKVTSA